MSSLLVHQDLPHSQPRLRFVHGIVGQNVAFLAPAQRIFITQEDQRRAFVPVPKSVLFAGVRPTVGVGVPIAKCIQVPINQEQPFHPLPRLIPGVRPTIGVGISIDNDTLNQTIPQEQPFHPLPRLIPGVRPAIGVGLGVENSITVPINQEQPFHPISVLKNSTIFTTPAGPAGLSSLVGQEAPQRYMAPVPAPLLISGVGPQIGVPPSISDIIQVPINQEQPFHPQPILKISIQGPDVSPFLPSRKILVTQEDQRRAFVPVPKSTLLSGVRPFVGVPVSITDSLFLSQEQPSHPAPTLKAGAAFVQSTLMTPEMRALLVKQEQPFHPASFVQKGIQGPNVGSGIGSIFFVPQERPLDVPSAFQPGILVTSATPLKGGAILVVQELPAPLPTPIVFSGVAPSTPLVSAFGIGTAITIKPPELWIQPSLRFVHGILGQNVASGIKSSIQIPIVQEFPQFYAPLFSNVPPTSLAPITAQGVTNYIVNKQEKPDEPISIAVVIYPPLVATSVGAIINFQEQPAQPKSNVFAQPPTSVAVAANIARGIIGKPQDPGHPGSGVFSGVRPFVGVPSSITDIISIPLVQEQPSHPAPLLKISIPGPDVGVVGNQRVSITQEQPPYLVSYLFAGNPPVTQPVPAVTRSLFIKQEQPFHPSSVLVIGAAFVPTTFITATLRYFFTKQELPDHPLSKLFPGNSPTTVPPITIGRSIRTTQEFPDHPSSRFATGVQGPNVGSPEARSLIIKQEYPSHPASALFPGTPPILTVPVPKFLISAQTRQDYPDHPSSRLFPGLPPIVGPIIGRSILVRQELPDHPGSKLLPSAPPIVVPAIIGRAVFTKQELPDHPASKTFPGTPPTTVPAITVGRSIWTTQQLPDHPRSQLLPSLPPRLIVAATQGALMVRLEIPGYHPSSILSSGPVFGLPAVAVTAKVTISSWGTKTKVSSWTAKPRIV